MKRFQETISILEGLKAPFLIATTFRKPTYLSAKAAFFLGVKRPRELSACENQLSPILECCPSDRHPFISSEVTTKTTDGISIQLFLKSGLLDDNHYIIFIQPLTALRPFYNSLKHAYHLRQELLDMKCRQASLKKDFTGPQQNVADLMGSINDALNIADSLLDGGVRLKTEIKSSVLLGVPKYEFLRFFLLLVLELGDFCRPSGIIKVKSVVTKLRNYSQREKQSAEETPSIEVVMLGERESESVAEVSLLEQAILRQCFQRTKSITTVDEEPTIKLMKSGESTLNNLLSSDRRSTTLGNNDSLPRESWSRALIEADTTARKHQLEWQIRRPEPDIISIYCVLPIIGPVAKQ